MFGESGITMEETSDFSTADASVIVNLELTKLKTNDFKFFLLLFGFNNFETLWYHCWKTADTTCKWRVFCLQARGEVLELDHVSSQFLFPLVGQCTAGHVSECS